MFSRGCFLHRGGGQRAGEGGQHRLQRLNAHKLLIQSSHNLGRSEVIKSFTQFFIYKPQQIYSSCGTTGNPLIHQMLNLQLNWK